MGTSKSLKTPSGQNWKQAKLQLTKEINGTQPLDAKQFVRAALRAVGGLAIQPRASFSLTGSADSGTGSRPAGEQGGLGGALQGLGGFGSQIGAAGLDGALDAIGLSDLRGRPAAEVVARIAEKLSSNAEGRQAEILEAALQETIFEIAAAEGDGSYEDLEDTLQAFIEREGIEGFVELFLAEYLFTSLAAYFENHVNSKADANEAEALLSAIEGACKSMVADELRIFREHGEFDQVDWFGPGGKQFIEEMVLRLEDAFANFGEA